MLGRNEQSSLRLSRRSFVFHAAASSFTQQLRFSRNSFVFHAAASSFTQPHVQLTKPDNDCWVDCIYLGVAWLISFLLCHHRSQNGATSRSTGEVLAMYWTCAAQVLDVHWRGAGDVLDMYCRGARCALERCWRYTGHVLQRCWI